ncbi:DUF977 family protein [Lelliottia amnigena]|uniref:DUF977 family protein n=1 Tax=Lelliottia amnigena TaxID=61646 RepID=UPI00242DA2D7|nr:DUF977 family protein [Lelliottia amnigena]
MARPKTQEERRLIISWIIALVRKYGHATTKDVAAMFAAWFTRQMVCYERGAEVDRGQMTS